MIAIIGHFGLGFYSSFMVAAKVGTGFAGSARQKRRRSLEL